MGDQTSHLIHTFRIEILFLEMSNSRTYLHAGGQRFPRSDGYFPSLPELWFPRDHVQADLLSSSSGTALRHRTHHIALEWWHFTYLTVNNLLKTENPNKIATTNSKLRQFTPNLDLELQATIQFHRFVSCAPSSVSYFLAEQFRLHEANSLGRSGKLMKRPIDGSRGVWPAQRPNEGEKAGSPDKSHRFEWTEQRRDIVRNISILSFLLVFM